jgi:deferrochelatase/peroxidase EfeB
MQHQPEMNRRRFLAGVGMSALAAGCAGAPSPVSGRRDTAMVTSASTQPQQSQQHGVITQPPAASLMAAFDLTISGRTQLTSLLRRLSALTASSIAGAEAKSRDLTITVAAGASLFDDRFGLGRQQPARLRQMPPFPNDALDPAWCHGDVLIQVCAKDRTTVRHILQHLQQAGSRTLRRRWSLEGFRPENVFDNRGSTTTRNLFGFREGVGNPDPANQALMDQLQIFAVVGDL